LEIFVFEKKTFVVVGAGASNEARLPTGNELKTHIAQLLDIRFDFNRLIGGDHLLSEAFRIAASNEQPSSRDINPYLHESWRIRDAIPQAISIDNFLDVHQGNARLERCGKLAIVRSILESERRSLLFVDPRGRDRHPNYSALEGTWYSSFFQLLTENCRQEHLAERLSLVTLVVFNYDRCVEQFLHLALQNYYGLTAERATELLRNLKVIHPYGSVGALPWQGGLRTIAFGDEPSARALFDLSGEIKTFTEGTDPQSSDIQELRARLVAARIVLFLGFAFHKQNLRLLSPVDIPHEDADQVKYFATAKGLSQSDCEVVTQELVRLAGATHQHIVLRNDLKCAPLFAEYWRSLALA
jgi:hypothetical protein